MLSFAQERESDDQDEINQSKIRDESFREEKQALRGSIEEGSDDWRWPEDYTLLSWSNRSIRSEIDQTGYCAYDATSARWDDYRRYYEGDRLATAFGARLLCRCGSQEAEAQSCLRKAGRRSPLLDRQISGIEVMDIRSTVNGRPVDPDVETELDRLRTLSITALRIRYRELLRTDPPAAFGPDLLRRSIAQRIQEQAYGGLSREAKKLLGQLIRTMASGKAGRFEIPQRIKPGSELVRIWKDQTHKVTVLAKGFAYQGEVFASLSEVANRITGTRWNGPKFFGLRTPRKEADRKTPVRATSQRADHGRG